MMPVIRISDETWDRLKAFAVPLEDSPEDVIKRLLEIAEHADAASSEFDVAESPIAADSNSVTPRGSRLARGIKVSQDEYDDPIMLVLYELGGRASANKILELVEKKMRNQLTAADHERLPSGELRWRRTAQWAKYNLLHNYGFLRDDSPRGIWELSDQGREWIEKKFLSKGADR